MNIYLHLEVSNRELDSKLLLATLAASRGHDVIVSDQESVIKGLTRKFLSPGIFHTKSLTPGKFKILKHQKIIDTGCKITSIDEEGGLIDYGYDKFAKLRYSNKTLKQASAIFTWGPEDYKTLKKIYPSQSKKIYKTGSPRADLWRPFFFDYWENKNQKYLKKPFLLVSSNFGGVLNMKSLDKRIVALKKGGYFDRDPNMLKRVMDDESEKSKMIGLFVEAMKYIANKNKNFNIILRPHPVENIYLWKTLLNGIKNIKVIRDDSISLWVKNSFAIMHNGCTTALEATISQKPVISYTPFKAEFTRELANDLGFKATTLKKLTYKIEKIFKSSRKKKFKKTIKTLPPTLLKKIHIDEKEFAALKMVKIWETLNDKELSKSNNWFIYMCSLKIMKLNGIIGRYIKKIFKKNFHSKENHKFSHLNKEEIIRKITKLQKILGIEDKLSYKILSDRTLLIKQK